MRISCACERRGSRTPVQCPNITDLRRVARAHVVDHRQLSNDALAAAIIKSQPQYVDRGTLERSVYQILHDEPKEDVRVLAYVFLVDVLLEQYDTQLPEEETDERVIGFEQRIVDRSNENVWSPTCQRPAPLLARPRGLV
jgi:hypothetical protein